MWKIYLLGELSEREGLELRSTYLLIDLEKGMTGSLLIQCATGMMLTVLRPKELSERYTNVIKL